MRKISVAAILMAAGMVALTPAVAADGCGPGRYRPLFGHCHWAGPPPGYYGPGPAYYAPPPPPTYYAPPPPPAYGPVIVDRWYPGRGYWDGRRYWWHRRGWYGGWRYY